MIGTKKPLPGTVEDLRYPDSYGWSMADTQYHTDAIIDLWQTLADHFENRHDIYVASRLDLYYDASNARARRAPDVLVAKGVQGKHKRDSFHVRDEMTLPCVLFEVVSRRSRHRDLIDNRDLYARIGVKEYFLFDPHFRYVDPMLQGFRTVNGKSVSMKRTERGLFSNELSLFLTTAGGRLRLIDPQSGKRLLTRSEKFKLAELRADLERVRADLAHRRATDLADEIEKLKARIAKLES